MLPDNTKVVVKQVPGESIFNHLLGAQATAQPAKGIVSGHQSFRFDNGGALFLPESYVEVK